ncbi:CpsD/CapB family tyrosine-protein kinase [Marinilactibacillus sp. Marseille-P9653]|uniref:CpsD/CapB family tyrosine-protein kinase n=1 Tax=Marinilactibacillus sp. Marseille-P9653 TaxID=2866583 RepID=UPI001CE3C07D|nr:CpsD/CapB family tyrosine-protein kinase [Marinilactibacillus sp. Marseille-P9653]
MIFKKRVKQATDERGGLVVINKPSSVVSEQFRTIRTNIQFSMIDETIKSIVVTSAGPASGKSLISANLAATFASGDQKVLLIDADLRKPTVHKTFKIKNDNGLTNLLTDKATGIMDVIHHSGHEGLYLITSGAIPPNPSELLSSNRMKSVCKEMYKNFDIVIFDMPPVLAVTDAQIMASKVDGVLFVIPKNEVTKDQVLKSKELLENVQANVLGSILNKVDKTEDSYFYYYEN